MNTFGKMGLLCCLAAVLLAGCGDGDRDVSAVSAHKKKWVCFAVRRRFCLPDAVTGTEIRRRQRSQEKRRSTTDKIYQVEHPAGDGGKERIR